MTEPCTVLIAAPDLLPALRKRTAGADAHGELLTFANADALRALDVITKRRPAIVALERLFAATPRGAALINRIKADPTLAKSEIRVVSHDTDYTRISPRRSSEVGPGTAAASASTPSLPEDVSAPALDQRGTRRAARFRIAPPLDVAVDGNPAARIDLSTVGAQVVSLRFNGAVAWASFEIPPKGGPRYRAGIEFLDADASSVDAYCSRHKA